ncbi:MAG TPA: FecR family protein, partial [Luteolibacter sp.]|nr:FecR family protein [Luteolibacter sp.]
EHGVAELQLPRDVRAVIESPARLSMIDERTLRLDHGHAFFEVTSAAGKGFTVVTPRQRIVDLGTVFGVVARNGDPAVDLHVFDGRVRVDSPDGDRGDIIPAGRSVRLAGQRVDGEIESAPASFLRELPENVEVLLVEDFSTGLLADTEYAVLIDQGAIVGETGRAFPGINGGEGWTFRTASAAPQDIPVRNPGFEEDGALVNKGAAIAGWRMENMDGWGWGVDSRRDSLASTEGRFFGRVFEGHYLSQVTGEIIRPGTTYVLTMDVGLSDSAATLRLFGGDPANVLAEKTIAPSSEGWLRDQCLVFTADESHAAGLALGISMTCSSGSFVAFDRVRLGSPGHGAHDALQPPPSILSDEDTGENPPDGRAAPPQISGLLPADAATDAISGGPLVIRFDQAIHPGQGRIHLRNITNWSEMVFTIGDSRLTIDGPLLTIRAPAELEDGETRMSRLGGWESTALTRLLNPAGDGRWYRNDSFRDKSWRRGPLLASLDASVPGSAIRRSLGTIRSDTRHSVSAGIGVRDPAARESAPFAGYRIRLVSGDFVLAELAAATPPGPPNEITSTGFSWDSSDLPDGLAPGDPLALEISLHPDAATGYLDLEKIRVTAVLKPAGVAY